ncbi:MAG: pyrroline-5-carboxylate reductase [Rhodobacteraceae bacterium]|nr:MAG: pyrroline-5-carboxylate reductase [Paracoccaceae bacterium]
MSFDKITTQGMVLLGCGKMGSAMLAGWLSQGIPSGSIHVIEPHPSDWLRGTGVVLDSALPEAPAVAILAVKPQMMGAALPRLQNLGDGKTLFISVAAGTSLAQLAATLGDQAPVIRAMPNTPAAVGAGITALIGNTRVTGDDMAMAEALLAAVGTTVQLQDEAQMDAVTGLSGSGPAYVFHLIEAMAAAGEAEGLEAGLAMTLARATVIGAGQLALASTESAAQLRMNVTSPQGTTAAALDVLMPELTGLMTRAIAAAAKRSRELSQ